MKRNLPLVLGSLILLLILLVMLVPGMFTSVNPYGTQNIKSLPLDNGKYNLDAPPFPPGPDEVLGTDNLGRDILALIIYGTKLTLTLGFLVVLGRYVVALPIGVAAGFGSFVAKTAINQFNVIFSAIPALIISVIVLKMQFFMALDKKHSTLAFVLVLTFVGWAKLSSIIMERVQEILARPFIKGEIAIGKSNFRIALENVMPHLAPELVILFFMEIAAALTMIMQMGIFGVFIGNLKYVEDTQGGVITFLNISLEPEWAGMLATARNYIFSAPWMVIFPAAAFFVSIIGFNLFGEGLRKVIQQRDSRFIVYLRAILSFRLRMLRPTRKTIAAVIVLALLITSAFSLYALANRPPVFDYGQQALAYSPQAKEVVVGNDQQTASELANELKQLGYQPLPDKNFIVEYETPPIYSVVNVSAEVVKGAEKTELSFDKDFSVASFGNLNLAGEIYDARQEDLYSVDYHKYDDKFVLVDSNWYSAAAIKQLLGKVMENSRAKGIFCVVPQGDSLPESIGKDVYSGVVMWVTPETAQKLAAKGSSARVVLESKQLESLSRNVIGVLPGQDPRKAQEYIIIGLSYNYPARGEEIGKKRIAFGLELAKEIALQGGNRNRNIVIAFWDGTFSEDYHGINYYTKEPILSPDRCKLYLDLTKIDSVSFDEINLGTDQSPMHRYFAFSFARQLEKGLEAVNIPFRPYDKARIVDEVLYYGTTVDEKMFYEDGIPAIIVQVKKDQKQGTKNLDDLGKVILQTIKNNSY